MLHFQKIVKCNYYVVVSGGMLASLCVWVKVQIILFVKPAFFSAKNNMKCIRMHDHFKFPGILDQCHILSRGHFL